MAEVTPLRAPAKEPKKRAPRIGLRLRESDELEHFTTLDVLSGLCGVCEALDDAVGTGSMDLDTTHRLSIAGKVLSSILMDRAETP
jgi:hypothetical protein